ncbi:hypothetical protein KUTeg_021473 [Tegillarca granosa]|uniref:Transposase n=1 Tax=Tegillarca granosa TaxID=220873 RepID=A0ABQ9E6L3_TEGGR|nr:hypothetical protein KUTeg_021473 [Tegillarca granosa]
MDVLQRLHQIHQIDAIPKKAIRDRRNPLEDLNDDLFFLYKHRFSKDNVVEINYLINYFKFRNSNSTNALASGCFTCFCLWDASEYRFEQNNIVHIFHTIKENKYHLMENRGLPIPPMLQLLATFRFHATGYGLKPYLLTPVLNSQTRADRRYNFSHIRTRNTKERMFGVWKRRFTCIGTTLREGRETVYRTWDYLNSRCLRTANEAQISTMGEIYQRG